jgi:hypothetical protein
LTKFLFSLSHIMFFFPFLPASSALRPGFPRLFGLRIGASQNPIDGAVRDLLMCNVDKHEKCLRTSRC